MCWAAGLSRPRPAGALDKKLPAIAILYTLYARACDPVLEFLQRGGEHDDAQIVEVVMSTCFNGINDTVEAPARRR